MKMTQADFARAMEVSPKTVTIWKAEERIAMIGDLVDVEQSRAKLLEYSRGRSKAYKKALALGNKLPELLPSPGKGNAATLPLVSGTGERFLPAPGPWTYPVTVAPSDGYPTEAHDAANAIYCGADNMAIVLIRRGLDHDLIREAVTTWVAIEKRAAVECLEDSLDPPYGCGTWADWSELKRSWPVSDPAWGGTWEDLVEGASRPPRHHAA